MTDQRPTRALVVVGAAALLAGACGSLVQTAVPAATARPTLPSIAAGSSWIAFAADVDGEWSFDDGDAEIYVVDDAATTAVNLTDHSANDYSPEWSPDGSTIVFRTDRDGNHEIYAMDADGSDPRNLTRDPGEQRSPAWSPDGRTIAYASAGDGGFDIWLMDADGANQRRLAGPGLDEYPTFSPDGHRIAFTSYCTDCSAAALFVMDVDGSDRRELAPAAGWPDWSIDPHRLGYDAGEPGQPGLASMFTIDPDASSASPVRVGQGVQIDWSPDGARIVYTLVIEPPQTGFPCCADIMLGQVDGGGASRNLTGDLDGFAFEPTWRPIQGS